MVAGNDPQAQQPGAAPLANRGPRSVLDAMRALDLEVRSGHLEHFQPVQTGFAELDAGIGGGLRPGQLVLLSGPAGVGKTSLLLQIARNISASGQANCLFVCYEHETDYLTQRLISMESATPAGSPPGVTQSAQQLGTGPLDGLRLRDIADLVLRYRKLHPDGQGGFMEALAADPRGARALQRVARYWQSLMLMKGSSSGTDVDALVEAVRNVRASAGTTGTRHPFVLFVDYVQKIATRTPHTDEAAQSIEAIEGLKEFALSEEVIIVAIVAAETLGLQAQRLRLQHLLTSASVAYEADIIMLMNEKFDIVDRSHVEFNRYNAEQFHNYVVLSIEKNRSGSDLIDLELRKQLQFCHFRPEARRVNERLVSSRPRE